MSSIKEDKKNSLKQKIRNASMMASSEAAAENTQKNETEMVPNNAYDNKPEEIPQSTHNNKREDIPKSVEENISKVIPERERNDQPEEDSISVPEAVKYENEIIHQNFDEISNSYASASEEEESLPKEKPSAGKEASLIKQASTKKGAFTNKQVVNTGSLATGENEHRSRKAQKMHKPEKMKKSKPERTLEKDEDNKKSRKKYILPIIIFIFFIMLGSIFTVQIVVASFGKQKTEANTRTASQDIALEEGSGEASVEQGELSTAGNKEQERLNELAEDSRVYCIISSSPYFEDSKSKGSLFISNPKESRFYTQVIIKTTEGKKMYVSPLLSPDEKIEYDYLTNTEFDKGSYAAVAYFNYYTKKGNSGTDDDYKYLGSMSAEINVVID